MHSRIEPTAGARLLHKRSRTTHGASQNERSAGTDGEEDQAEATNVEHLVEQLNNVGNLGGLRGTYTVGSLIVRQLFHGDEAAILSARGNAAYARLKCHPRLSIGPADLYRALRLFSFGRRNPEVLDIPFLTVSHFLVVIGLHQDEQVRFLRTASEHSWTVRELRRRVAASDIAPSRTGRPRVPPILKTLKGPLATPEAFDGIEGLTTLDLATASNLLEVCARIRASMDQAIAALKMAGQLGRQARIMIVDSDPMFASRAKRLLRHHVRSVRIAHTSSQAVLRVDRQISCAVINLHLSDGCGYELSRRLLEAVPQLDCVFVSSTKRSELPESLRHVQPLVMKTSGLRDLAAAILSAIGRVDILACK